MLTDRYCALRDSCILNSVLFGAVDSVSGGTPRNGGTYVAGDVVLLVKQTTTAQNGPWVVGTVAAGSAPLTRPTWWPSGANIPPDIVIEVSEGTLLQGSSFKALCGKGQVVDTNDPKFYPRVCKGTLTLSSGTYTLGATEALMLFSTTTSAVGLALNTNGGTFGTRVSIGAPSASRVAGLSGTAAVVVNSEVSAGTGLATDSSTIDWTVTNW